MHHFLVPQIIDYKVHDDQFKVPESGGGQAVDSRLQRARSMGGGIIVAIVIGALVGTCLLSVLAFQLVSVLPSLPGSRS